MDSRETPVADTIAPQRILRDICAFETPVTFLTQEEIILGHMGMCCLLLTRARVHTRSTCLLPKRVSMAYVSLQVNDWTKINVR